jgi:hypothetical protein
MRKKKDGLPKWIVHPSSSRNKILQLFDVDKIQRRPVFVVTELISKWESAGWLGVHFLRKWTGIRPEWRVGSPSKKNNLVKKDFVGRLRGSHHLSSSFAECGVGHSPLFSCSPPPPILPAPLCSLHISCIPARNNAWLIVRLQNRSSPATVTALHMTDLSSQGRSPSVAWLFIDGHEGNGPNERMESISFARRNYCPPRSTTRLSASGCLWRIWVLCANATDKEWRRRYDFLNPKGQVFRLNISALLFLLKLSQKLQKRFIRLVSYKTLTFATFLSVSNAFQFPNFGVFPVYSRNMLILFRWGIIQTSCGLHIKYSLPIESLRSHYRRLSNDVVHMRISLKYFR